MSGKGKKWDAAEKHFQEYELDITRKSRKVEALNTQLCDENRALTALVDAQNDQIAVLNDWIDRLIVYAELPKDEVLKTFKSVKSTAELMRMLNAMGRYSG